MVAALGNDAPTYLKLWAASPTLPVATFSMYCFWSGEVALAGIDGVVSTRPGFNAGREVVDVRYDPDRISFSALLRAAANAGAASGYVARDAEEARLARHVLRDVAVSGAPTRYSKGDDKYQMKDTPWASVPMSAAQATRVNRALARGLDPAPYLSPRQVELGHAPQSRR
jgi:hypothetical protein